MSIKVISTHEIAFDQNVLNLELEREEYLKNLTQIFKRIETELNDDKSSFSAMDFNEDSKRKTVVFSDTLTYIEAKESNYQLLKTLGSNYSALEAWDLAAKAFAKILQFSPNDISVNRLHEKAITHLKMSEAKI